MVLPALNSPFLLNKGWESRLTVNCCCWPHCQPAGPQPQLAWFLMEVDRAHVLNDCYMHNGSSTQGYLYTGFLPCWDISFGVSFHTMLWFYGEGVPHNIVLILRMLCRAFQVSPLQSEQRKTLHCAGLKGKRTMAVDRAELYVRKDYCSTSPSQQICFQFTAV